MTVSAAMALPEEAPPLYGPPKLRSGAGLERAIQSITVSLQALERRRLRFRLAAFTLARTGILVIRRAVDPDVLEPIAALAERTWAEVSALAPGQSHPVALLNRDQHRVLKGYKALEESVQPVINVRHGEDDGMMDVFHPEELAAELREPILSCLHERLVADLAGLAFGQKLEVSCRNLYVNRGVRHTRFFHCDGQGLKVKTFVYLTPVRSLEDGPYCYIPGSHLDVLLRRRNQAFNKDHQFNLHEYRQVSDKHALPIFAEPGDLVISAQHGAHRGLPQAPSARRAVLVNVFKP
ncbi:phytanoyl-CoA dioxygenase family protein [Cyanobium sp. CH-040]|uniref:phytanoyl-CoA dioxygenase family protein n=1 Tax=Cyanobium sp. CH-040 TaxID=2823708 RepID=UPI0020CB927B|nr:phytanoyl-CoA dioxygenase family protein [Cyanobium sp. CH-040]MCP9927994.1 phytanoyl-CoA dioxygenase family protein [Cyanobium sp. CH-040]